MEVNLYEGLEFPFTTEWYKTREHAPHAEQWVHRPRMEAVQKMAYSAMKEYGYRSVVDLGAGDGGMLSLIKARAEAGFHEYHPPSEFSYWGYDLMQTNVDYARNTRQMDVRYLDFIGEPVDWGDLTIITECLEHLQDPHGMVRRIGTYSKAIIASSPVSETAEQHDACHAWVWDEEGYAALIEQGGFEIREHQVVTGGYDFQIILGVLP